MDKSAFLLTAVLGAHVLDALLLCRLLGLRGDDAFWGVVLAVFLQLGAVATALSLVQALTPAGWILALLPLTGAVTALVMAERRRVSPRGARPADRCTTSSHPLSALASGLLVLLVTGAAVVQWGTPLYKGDDLMYHGSRVLYWLQQLSLLPFETHNDRHNVPPIAAELPFLVGVLFTRSERVARLLHLSALPLAVWGVLRLERRLRVRAGMIVIGPLLFLTTPLVLAAAEGIGAELWTAVGLLGFLHCLLGVSDARCVASRGVWFLLGASTALCIAFKLTLLPLLGLLPFAVVLSPQRSGPRRRFAGALAAGLVLGAVTSGLALTLVGNAVLYGHPLGPARMRAVHSSDLGLRQLVVHAARAPFLIAGLPPVGSEKLRARLESDANRLARAVGARDVLPGEKRGWPGTFRVPLPTIDQRFSLSGLCVLGASLWLALQVWRRAHRQGFAVARWPPAPVLIVCVALFVMIVFLVRWQPSAGVPDRLLVPLLAPASALVSLALCFLWRVRALRGPLVAVILWGIAPGIEQLGARVARVIAEPPALPGRAGIFAPAAAALRPGARLLLLGSQNSGDYVLFGPAEGYANVVVPWGKSRFDRARLLERLAQHRPTHVLVENKDRVDFHWAGDLTTGRFVRAVAKLPGARRIPLPDPAMRLFALAPRGEAVEGAGDQALPPRR